jgi:hypothetical protein
LRAKATFARFEPRRLATSIPQRLSLENRAAANDVCPFPFWTYEEFIGAKKHLVLGVLSHTAPRR